jgi:hypothetical protein
MELAAAIAEWGDRGGREPLGPGIEVIPMGHGERQVIQADACLVERVVATASVLCQSQPNVPQSSSGVRHTSRSMARRRGGTGLSVGPWCEDGSMEPIVELNEGFSEPAATAPAWSMIAAEIAAAEMFWLSTVRGDGRPHVTPLPAVWDADALHFCTGDAEQKSRNLRQDPRCVLTTGTNALHGGIDVVIEGTAVRVTDRDRLTALAALWKSKLDWDYQVGDDAFRDGAGRTGLVFAVRPEKILAFGKDPYSQTRYRFAG